MSDLPKFLRELFSSFWSSICVVLTVLSIITLVHPFNFASKRYRWILLTAAMVSWPLASFVLYRRKERQIEALNAELENLKARRPQLVIWPETDSKYYVEVDRIERSKVLGIYFLLRLTIENKGDTNSVLSEFELFIRETKASCPQLQPEVRKYIQSHKTQFALGPPDLLGQRSMVVEAHNRQHGTLPLYISGAPPENVHVLHCTLTVTDTEGTKASKEFTVIEEGQ